MEATLVVVEILLQELQDEVKDDQGHDHQRHHLRGKEPCTTPIVYVYFIYRIEKQSKQLDTTRDHKGEERL